jgi:beta-N-acetylhexosaminidase
MKITGAQFADMQSREGQGDGEDMQEGAAPRQETAQPANEQRKRTSEPLIEKIEEGPVTTGKEAPEQGNTTEKSAEDGPVSVLETASPEEAEAALAPGAKTQQNPGRPPSAPRKNVIPPRRTSFENGHRAPFAASKHVRLAGNAQDSPQPAADDLSETASRREQQGTPSEIAEMPTSALPPVAGPRANEQVERQARVDEMPTSALPVQKPQSQQVRREARVDERRPQSEFMETQKIPASDWSRLSEQPQFAELPTTPLPAVLPATSMSGRGKGLTRGRALFLALLLIILIINATVAGFGQFFGPQGWGSVFNGPGGANQNLLSQLRQQLQHTPTPGVKGQPTAPPLTPEQIVDRLLANMTLQQKLGQMLMVRFNSLNYSPQLNAMITQYHVGSVIEYQGNIESKAQLTSLNAQIQHNGDLPMIISIDQEGGTVDRLINLDGPQPSASSIGATNDPNVAYQQGMKDAQYLASYGFNLNLAPVVDVNNVYNSQLYGRTYGTNPTIVTTMAGAYLNGLQHTGKVLGSIKHFPGLGDTSTDPHYGLPYLTRSLDNLSAVDWAPYKNLISKGNVYAVMVTHEIVKALDPNIPSSLSPKVISVLRNQLGFQGVIITDGLTMQGITDYYTLGQAAVMAVEAGDDLLMDPGSPNEVAQMIDGLTQAVQSGKISQQRIDDSVRRILLLKYQMGLLQLNS